MKKRCVAEAHVVDGLSECQGGKACFFFTACAQKKIGDPPNHTPSHPLAREHDSEVVQECAVETRVWRCGPHLGPMDDEESASGGGRVVAQWFWRGSTRT